MDWHINTKIDRRAHNTCRLLKKHLKGTHLHTTKSHSLVPRTNTHQNVFFFFFFFSSQSLKLTLCHCHFLLESLSKAPIWLQPQGDEYYTNPLETVWHVKVLSSKLVFSSLNRNKTKQKLYFWNKNLNRVQLNIDVCFSYHKCIFLNTFDYMIINIMLIRINGKCYSFQVYLYTMPMRLENCFIQNNMTIDDD